MNNPYEQLGHQAFWRSAVASSPAHIPTGLGEMKWRVSKNEAIATAGSCFAQHIGKRLRSEGFNILDVEPAPRSLPVEAHGEFGYSIYSARYGNIYTVRQFLQLAEEAFGLRDPCDIFWLKKNKYVDGLRPTVEPEGFDTLGAVAQHREYHLERVRMLFKRMDLLIFTMGLTECWVEKRTGRVLPMCPGTIAGEFDADLHEFRNFTVDEVLDDFMALRQLLSRRRRKDLRFLLTVSPVPLTATATGDHAMKATVYSKSVLRAAAGQLEKSCSDVAYFPSYEIVTNPWSDFRFFASNQRTVTPEGVALVMDEFMRANGISSTTKVESPDSARLRAAADASESELDEICDEVLLESFNREPS